MSKMLFLNIMILKISQKENVGEKS